MEMGEWSFGQHCTGETRLGWTPLASIWTVACLVAYEWLGRGNCLLLAATATLHNHVFVVLERDRVELVEVQHGDGREVRRAALHRRDKAWVDPVYERLDDGVVGGVGVVGQGEAALALTVEGAEAGLLVGRENLALDLLVLINFTVII